MWGSTAGAATAWGAAPVSKPGMFFNNVATTPAGPTTPFGAVGANTASFTAPNFNFGGTPSLYGVPVPSSSPDKYAPDGFKASWKLRDLVVGGGLRKEADAVVTKKGQHDRVNYPILFSPLK